MSNKTPMPLILIPIALLGTGRFFVGNDSLDAPKRPRSASQIAAFGKARAKRAENLSKLSKNVEKYHEKGNTLRADASSRSRSSS